MASLKEKVNTEFENIESVLSELEKAKNKKKKTNLELAGIGAFLHNFYSGIENILKQILLAKKIKIQPSSSWHQELLVTAEEKGVISLDTKEKLREYLAFRHFFVHAYSFLLEESEMKFLVQDAANCFAAFKRDIQTFV